MLGVYASAVAILLASVVLGAALLALLGRTEFTWLSGAVGFAALVVASPLLIRLPGRATTLAILLAITFLAAVVYLWRGEPVPGAQHLIRRRWRRGSGRASPAIDAGEEPQHHFRVAAIVIAIVLAASSLPFGFNERNGALGEGVYTNDQAAQLYWTDWLQHGVGPEPNAVRFGYPTGPQALAAAAAEVTGTTLLSAFNGLLLAIPVLTALAALAAIGSLPTRRRVVTASLTGLPYLGASFLAQSAFKETAMALLVLAFAVGLGELSRPPPARQPHPQRAIIVALLLIVVACVFVYSLPGLTWFAIGVPIWLALVLATRSLRVDLGAIGDAARRHRWAIAAVALVVIAVGAFSAAQLSGFVGKVGQVQASQGRLSSPVFPGEALGIWPEGDFRIVRGDVSGAYLALALGLVAAAIGAFGAVRRRDWGLVAMGASAVIAYAGARAFASIYVEAKALAILAPLVVLAALFALFSPGARGSGLATEEEAGGRGDRREGAPGSEPAAVPRMFDAKRLTFRAGRRSESGGPDLADTGGPGYGVRFAFGVVVAIALAASSFLALRAASVGFDQRANELQGLAGLVQGRSVAFLGVDRFAGYWLRGTLMRSPGGYVPADIQARPSKVWQQGLAMDFDTLTPGRLDKFRYVITTRAGYQSTPPPNFKPVVRTTSFVLWRRQGPTPDVGIIDVDGTPGAPLDCSTPEGRRILERAKTATVLADPVVNGIHAWSRRSPFDAPASVSQTLELRPGRWALSLQYHSQVPLTVYAGKSHVQLPPSLDGMYLTHQAQGAFWAAGSVRVTRAGPVRVRVSAAKPTRLQRFLGVRRQVWLGPMAATMPGSVTEVPIHRACGRYVDHFTFRSAAPSR